jgi:acid stress-induced BolA-like protein IbaG/YrbA
MAEIVERIRVAIEKGLPGAIIDDMAEVRAGGRVGGAVIWSEFRGIEQIERQEKLWAVLGEALSREEQLQISLIITLTPDELAAIQD